MASRDTRKRLLDAAYRIMSEESLSQLSIDKVSERAGLSRRTFFLHFSSKDQLIAQVLEHLRPMYAETYLRWSESLAQGMGADERVLALVRYIIDAIAEPEWKGCAFVRISAEFAERPGHPAHAVVMEAHRDMERWLESELRLGKFPQPALVARQIVVMINGLLITQLIHRKPSYGEAAFAVVPLILAAGKSAEGVTPGQENNPR